MNYWIGQACGIVATIAGISIPVFKKKWQMLILNITNNLFCALNLVFLNRIGSGIFLFLVATVQAIVNLVHTLRDVQGKAWEKFVFAALYLGLGFYGLFTAPGFVPAVNARNILELLPIAAAMLSFCFICSRKERTARLFFVGCNSLWAVYYAVIGSSAILGSIFSVMSGLFALYRNREKKISA